MNIRVRSTSAWVLVVFLATVLSPHFAWEAIAPDAHHPVLASDIVEAGFDAARHSESFPGQDHHDEHGCAGHQFGHLPIHVFQVTFPLPACGEASHPPRVAAAVRPGVPETPLRPPRADSFA